MIPCPECCPDPAACIIDTDDFSGDLSKWTEDGGTWIVAGSLLTISGAGRLTLIEEATTENDSTKIVTTVRCTADGVAWITIAENAIGDRIGMEMTQDGDCLTFRLATIDNAGGDVVYLTQPVAQFVATGGSQYVVVDMCWVQGAALTPEESDTGFVYPLNVISAVDWVNADEVLADDGSSALFEYFGAGSASMSLAFSADLQTLVPEGSTIDGLSVAIRCNEQLLSGLGQVTLEGLRFHVGLVPVGDDRGTGQGMTTTPALIENGGAADDWNAGLTWNDLATLGISLQFDSTGTVTIELDVVRLLINYTGPDREKGTLTVTCSPEAGMPAGGYTGKAMATARLYWKGTKAGLTVINGDWDWKAFVCYFEQHTLAHCPTCTTQCFIFGDTFDRDDYLGCHYIVDSGTFETDDTGDGSLTCLTAGKLYFRHITTEEVNSQVVEYDVTFPSSSNREAWIILGYDADGPSEYYARLRWVNADVKWYLGIYKDGVLIGSEAETTEGPESFPVTTHFKACLLGNSIFAESDFLEIQRTLDEDAIGLQSGLYSTADQVFENLRFYQTPFDAEDCPPCGEPDECTICLDGIAPAHLLFRMFSAQNGEDCDQCTLFNESFLLVGIAGGGVHDFDYIDCGETPLEDVTVCSWEYLVSDGPDPCFEPEGAGLYIFAFLVRDNLTNNYYLTVRAGGPTVIGPGYAGGDSYYLLRADLGVHDTEPDCYELLADVRLEFVCIKLRDEVFDCRGTPIGFIAAV